MAQGKLRILYLMDILLKNTDEQHTLNAEQLISKLETEAGERADRKTIYRDMESLKEFGLDIRQIKGSAPGYYIASREFTLSELKLLVDAVQSSKFISRSMTDQLIRKLENLTSHPKAALLQRQVYILNRAKTDNDTVLLNVDVIHTAINSNQDISFQYGEWTVGKTLRLRKDGERYIVSPWALVWEDENYYLVGYSRDAEAIRHYRVDKMLKTMVYRRSRTGEDQFRDFDLASYTKKTFGMFAGENVNVTLECANSLAGVMIDRFGRDILLIPQGSDKFRLHVDVAVSPQFFGWAAGMGPRLKICSPSHVADQYRTYLQEILNNNA